MDEKKSKNPYEVLRLPEGASREEIDKAYTSLASSYSELDHFGSPMQSIAQERLSELRQAYAKLTGETPPAPELTPEQKRQADSRESERIRGMINSFDLDQAAYYLNRMPDRDENPEWLYLQAMIAWKRGWLDESTQLIERAEALDPSNKEYRTARKKMKGGRSPSSLRIASQANANSSNLASECCAEGLCGPNGLCSCLCSGC